MSRPPPIRVIPRSNASRIVVGLYPGDDHPISLEMASTLGSSTAFAEVAEFTQNMLQVSGYRWSWEFPNDGRRRYFRARHTAPGWTAGAYTRTVSAIPKIGRSIDSSTTRVEELILFSPSPEWGGIMTDLPKTKQLIVGGGELRPVGSVSSTAYDYSVSGQTVIAASDGVTMDLVKTFIMPAGVTITGLQSHQFREVTGLDTGAGAIVQFGYTTGSTDAATVLDTLQTSSGSADYQIFDSTTLAYTVTANDVFFLLGRVAYGTSTDKGGLGLQKISYTSTAYENVY